MATSGALSTSNEYIKYKITITQNSQSTANNTSNVTVSVKFYRTNTGYTTYGTGTVYCTINGTKYTAAVTSSQKITNSGIVLFTKTLNIAHNSDGTKKLTVSAYIDHERVTSSSQSYSLTLTTIARKSTLTASNGTLGTAQTLTINRQASSFTHTITYKCGTASGTITTKTTGTSVSFTPPASLASQNTTGTSVSITFTITTYSGSTSIGSNTKTITCSIPNTDAFKPKITAFTLTEAVSGLAAQFGGYVNEQSKIKYTVSTETAYNAAIKSYSVSIAGQSFTKASATTAAISTTAGTKTATVTVTDARGRKATKSVTFTVFDYSMPQFNEFSVERCLATGTPDEEGECLRLRVDALVSPVNNKNTATYALSYKKTGDSSFKALTFENGNEDKYNPSGEYIIDDVVFSVDSSYIIRFEITDYFKEKAQKTVNVSSASAILDILADGSGIAFNKIAERSGFIEFALKMWAMYGDIITSPVALTSDTDLNNLLDAGFYIVANTTISATILNKPPFLDAGDTSTATVEVGIMGDGAQRYQKYYLCSKTLQMTFQRIWYQNSWGDWVIVSGCSSWRSLTVASGFENYNAADAPKYRINGNLVTVTGAVKPTATVTSNTNGVQIASGIDAAFCPARSTQFVCQGSAINRWTLTISPSGYLYVARYGKEDYVDISAGSWLTFCVTYSI